MPPDDKRAGTASANDKEEAKSGNNGRRAEMAAVATELLVLPPTSGHTPSMITFNCELCNVQCSSEEVFETHLKGQKHQKKVKRKQELEQSGMAEQIQNSDTYCKVCSVELTSKAHMPLHLAGKRHRQNLMKALSSSAPETDIAKSVEEFDKKQKEEEQVLIDRAGIKDFSKYAIPAEKKQQALAEGAKNEFYCKLCNKFFTGRTQLAMHLMSVRHKEKENPTAPRPAKRPMRGAAARRFFDVDAGVRPYDASNFYQNSVSDLSADFSLPSSKIACVERNADYNRQRGAPPSATSSARSDFYASPDRYTRTTTPLPPTPSLPPGPKPFYSTYQTYRTANWRSSRSAPSRSWQESRISGDFWQSPRGAEPPHWQREEDLYDEPFYDHRMNDMGGPMGGGRAPHWYSGMMCPPQGTLPRGGNFYEDYNPADFDSNFSYRGPL